MTALQPVTDAPVDLMGDSPAESRRLIEDTLTTCGAYLLPERVSAQGPDWLEVTWTPATDAPWWRTDGHGTALLLPGTVTTELAVQAGELLIFAIEGGRRPADGVPVLGRIRRARYLRPIAPGAPIRARVTLAQRLGPAFYCDAEVRTDEGVAAKIALTFTATEAVARMIDGE